MKLKRVAIDPTELQNYGIKNEFGEQHKPQEAMLSSKGARNDDDDKMQHSGNAGQPTHLRRLQAVHDGRDGPDQVRAGELDQVAVNETAKRDPARASAVRGGAIDHRRCPQPGLAVVALRVHALAARRKPPGPRVGARTASTHAPCAC